MNRVLAWILMLALAVSLIGCGAKGQTGQREQEKQETDSGSKQQTDAKAAQSVTLKLWAGIQPEYGYDEMVKNFNEEFADKGIQLEYTRYVNNDDGNLQLDTYLMGGNDVDIFLGYGGVARLKKRVDANLVLEMTPHLASRGFDSEMELGENNVRGTLLDGKIYALPTKYENSNWILANADLFKEAGIELPVNGWTYSEFLDVVQKLTKGEGPDKVYGMFWWLVGGGTSSVTSNLGAVLGKYRTYTDDTCTSVNFDHQVYKDELQMIMDVMDNGWSPTYADEKSDSLSFANMFLEGKAAMSFGISQLRITKDLETYPHDFETALIPFPVPDESYMDVADYNGIPGSGDLICVSSKTRHIEEAMDFVIWYIKGGMAPLAKGGRIPLWKNFDSSLIVEALNETPGVFDENSLQQYLSIDSSNSYESLDTAYTTEIGDIKKEGFESIFLGQKSVEEALAQMKVRCDELLSK